MTVEMIKEVREWKRLKEECEAHISEIETAIKAEMQETGVSKITIGEYKISLSEVSRTTVDNKELERVHPDIFAAFSKISKFFRLNIR